ncbi:MAG: hypothetical protein DDT40_01461 [candidate division WS2 bacterium]|nr:hypothetical protein [Candidatus Psychracetigena formicireducens]
MALAQILFGLYFALVGAYLSIVLTRALRQNGAALNELKKLINELKELIKVEGQGIKSLIKEKSP